MQAQQLTKEQYKAALDFQCMESYTLEAAEALAKTLQYAHDGCLAEPDAQPPAPPDLRVEAALGAFEKVFTDADYQEVPSPQGRAVARDAMIAALAAADRAQKEAR